MHTAQHLNLCWEVQTSAAIIVVYKMQAKVLCLLCNQINKTMECIGGSGRISALSQSA